MRGAPRAGRGFLLIELMIVIAIIGIGAAGAWSIFRMFDDPGRPGHAAIRQEQATEVLIAAHQAALVESLVNEVGDVARALPSAHASIQLSRRVTRATPDLLRVEWTARWNGWRGRSHARTLTALTRASRATR